MYLAGIFKGIPAFIVAGGPSLDKNIHLLPSVKGKGVIISVDTVLPALLRKGVKPDFVTSIDSQNLTFEKIADVSLDVEGISLITMPWVNRKVSMIFPFERRFWWFSGHRIEKWMNRIVGGTINERGAGRVAHLNLISAIVFGCSPIVFIGQDLAYTGGATHAKNTALTGNLLMEKSLKKNFFLPGMLILPKINICLPIMLN